MDAAVAELRKQTLVIDPEALYKDAEEGFAALNSLLGSDTWFFAAETPGMLDAAAFAYTHLLLREGGPGGDVAEVRKSPERDTKGATGDAKATRARNRGKATSDCWAEPRLRNAVLPCRALVAHRSRILDQFYGGMA